MCGIAAIVASDGGLSSVATVTRMLAVLKHRGPDNEDVYNFGHCVLGNARLSIVDVGGGRQPILSGDRQTGVTFNGAIYGFRQLKTTLTQYPFKTGTDTEVILALYAKYGDDFLPHLPGMFAFALWDERRRTLICARDRFGEKPLYYAYGRTGEFIIASEIKSILASGLVEPILNTEAVSHYLQRIHAHPSHTIYLNVHVLPPAHVLQFCGGRLKLRRYWELPDIDKDVTMQDAIERFRELFDAAVRKQLVADVPVGVLLSGGVDSSTVTAVANQHQPALKTFSFGFQAGVENELPFARAMAERHGTHHFELTDDRTNIPDLLWRMQDIYDEPFADSSNIPTYLICEFARKHVTVALGGDGADELLGGYLYWSRHLLSPPASEIKAANSPRDLKAMLGLQKLVRLFEGNAKALPGSPLARRYAQEFRVCFTPQEQQTLGLTVDAGHLIDYQRYQTGTINDLLRFDTELYLPGDVLVKTDRASMANGLELRTPYLDVDVASFCLSLPDTLKVDGEREKLLLRHSYGHLWTDGIRGRAKQGFGAPMTKWLRSAKFSELKREFFGDRNQPIFGVLDFDAVQPFVERNNQQTWSLLVLALWMFRHPCSLPAN